MDKSKMKNLNNFKIKFKELIREKITNNKIKDLRFSNN